jgi:hypothetical protein
MREISSNVSSIRRLLLTVILASFECRTWGTSSRNMVDRLCASLYGRSWGRRNSRRGRLLWSHPYGPVRGRHHGRHRYRYRLLFSGPYHSPPFVLKSLQNAIGEIFKSTSFVAAVVMLAAGAWFDAA